MKLKLDTIGHAGRQVYIKDSNELVNLNMRVLEVQQLFFKHVRETIFELAKPRTLLGLLKDYHGIMDSIPTKMVKSMLMKEFGDKIGFHERYRKNHSIRCFC